MAPPHLFLSPALVPLHLEKKKKNNPANTPVVWGNKWLNKRSPTFFLPLGKEVNPAMSLTDCMGVIFLQTQKTNIIETDYY